MVMVVNCLSYAVVSAETDPETETGADTDAGAGHGERWSPGPSFRPRRPEAAHRLRADPQQRVVRAVRPAGQSAPVVRRLVRIGDRFGGTRRGDAPAGTGRGAEPVHVVRHRHPAAQRGLLHGTPYDQPTVGENVNGRADDG